MLQTSDYFVGWNLFEFEMNFVENFVSNSLDLLNKYIIRLYNIIMLIKYG